MFSPMLRSRIYKDNTDTLYLIVEENFNHFARTDEEDYRPIYVGPFLKSDEDELRDLVKCARNLEEWSRWADNLLDERSEIAKEIESSCERLESIYIVETDRSYEYFYDKNEAEERFENAEVMEKDATYKRLVDAIANEELACVDIDEYEQYREFFASLDSDVAFECVCSAICRPFDKDYYFKSLLEADIIISQEDAEKAWQALYEIQNLAWPSLYDSGEEFADAIVLAVKQYLGVDIQFDSSSIAYLEEIIQADKPQWNIWED